MSLRRTPLTRKTPLRRGAPLKRTGSLRRTGPIKPKKRTAAEKRRVYGTDARIAWMKARPCEVPGCHVTGCDLAHAVSGGMGRKSDYTSLLALCHPHHSEQHLIGTPAFEAKYGISLTDAAARTEAEWQAHTSS